MYNLHDKRQCPICGGVAIIERRAIRSNNFNNNQEAEMEWKCMVCKTKFYAHFMITEDGTIKVLDKEIEKAMEGIRVMGETKNKWRM